jgi:8-oxo-dGTP pyrophosphatase MutT (NUDIX family)
MKKLTRPSAQTLAPTSLSFAARGPHELRATGQPADQQPPTEPWLVHCIHDGSSTGLWAASRALGLDSRLAAVAVTMFRRNNQWWIPLTMRPQFLKHHGGQLCLPGGRVESGEGVIDAALREFRGRVGVRVRGVQYCGELPTQYVYASDNRVHPIVALIQPPQQKWQPDPSEVAEIIELPLNALLDPTQRATLIREKTVRSDAATGDVLTYRARRSHLQCRNGVFG